MWRHCISKLRGSLSPQKMPEGTPLLDAASLEYLFYQVVIYLYSCSFLYLCIRHLQNKSYAAVKKMMQLYQEMHFEQD